MLDEEKIINSLKSLKLQNSSDEFTDRVMRSVKNEQSDSLFSFGNLNDFFNSWPYIFCKAMAAACILFSVFYFNANQGIDKEMDVIASELSLESLLDDDLLDLTI